MKNHSRVGFTLVELLVVIAIISILAALLLPVLRKVMEAARQVACASNQKQLYLGMTGYVDDHGGILPPAQGNSDCSQGSRLALWYWSDFLAADEYIHVESPFKRTQDYRVTYALKLPGVFRCTSADEWSNKAGYGMPNNSMPGKGCCWLTSHPATRPYRLANLKPEGVLLAEGKPWGLASWYNSSNIYDSSIQYRHGERGNFLYAGGNVGCYGKPYFLTWPGADR